MMHLEVKYYKYNVFSKYEYFLTQSFTVSLHFLISNLGFSEMAANIG